MSSERSTGGGGPVAPGPCFAEGGRVSVLGIGNVLAGDDGVGPTVIRRLLDRRTIPSRVEVHDIGTPGFDLIPFMEGRDAVIVVDAVRAPHPPGTVVIADLDDVLRNNVGRRTGPHDPSLADAIRTLEFAGCAPLRLYVIGVVPKSSGSLAELSSEVRAAVPRAEAAVAGVLARLGDPLPERRGATATVPWWRADGPAPTP